SACDPEEGNPVPRPSQSSGEDKLPAFSSGDLMRAESPQPFGQRGERSALAHQLVGFGRRHVQRRDGWLLAAQGGIQDLLETRTDGRIVVDAEALGRQGRLAAVDGHQVAPLAQDRKSTRLNSSHVKISYAVFCLKK